jgi:hypothetical protein
MTAQLMFPFLGLEMQSQCADIEVALAMGLLSEDKMSENKFGIWRDNFDASIFDAAMRAGDRFKGIAAALERCAPKDGPSDVRRELALWESALGETKARPRREALEDSAERPQGLADEAQGRDSGR